MKRIEWVWSWIEIRVAGLLTLIATSILIYAIGQRYFFHHSPSWALEIVIYMVIWAVFLLTSNLIKDDGHVNADFLLQSLSDRGRHRLSMATTTLSLPFSLAAAWLGFLHVHDLYDFDMRSTTALQFPLWIAQSAVPVGMTLVSLRLIRRLTILITSPPGTEDSGAETHP